MKQETLFFQKEIISFLYVRDGFKRYQETLQAKTANKENFPWDEWTFLCFMSEAHRITERIDCNFLFYLGEILSQPRVRDAIKSSTPEYTSAFKRGFFKDLIKLSNKPYMSLTSLGATFALAADCLSERELPRERIHIYESKYKQLQYAIKFDNFRNDRDIGKAYLTLMMIAQLLYNHTQQQSYFQMMCIAAKEAANRNEPLGLTYYGYFLQHGYGFEKNPELAYTLYARAADAGCVMAQRGLAACFEHGMGIKKSPLEARFWLQRAAGQGSAEAQYELGYYYLNENTLDFSVRKAANWLSKAAQQNHSMACNQLGMIALAENTVKGYEEAARLFTKASRLENLDAKFNLATLYKNGTGVPQSAQTAFNLMLDAARNGLPAAQNDLGAFYEAGFGVTRNLRKAIEWFKKAAANGDSLANYNLRVLEEREIAEKESKALQGKYYGSTVRAQLFNQPIPALADNGRTMTRRGSF